jgi:hypothetical protein
VSEEKNENLSMAMFDTFADMHPHEAYEYDKNMFWEYVKKKCPSMTKDEMVRLLKETES